ncbi:MAG: DNA polymerase III subunit gamma/tau [Arenicella sp.]
MTYLALARKWRPKIFTEVMGQSHVVKALSNALNSGRVHHAFLFTGTRGVGKTTLARIFAKSLNCEQGMSATPCGECSICVNVDQGRFIDLIEVDAASRTGIDDMRELLDNIQYAPTQGRYKVYLIDEIHMLSKSSFNALLKTLEEPPEHVKFLFATTDPQKLPVTVLSRCLQFNLKALQPNEIAEQISTILTAENIPFDESGVQLISRAADGSLRDALSLLEQGIAQGGGNVEEESIRSMLGTVKAEHMDNVLNAILQHDIPKALSTINSMASYAADFNAAINQLLVELHTIALAQVATDALSYKVTDVEKYLNYAQQISPEDIQLCYQIALMGKRDIALAPDYRSGFEMAILRIMAFKPADQTRSENTSQVITPVATPTKANIAKPEITPTATHNTQHHTTSKEATHTPPKNITQQVDQHSSIDLNTSNLNTKSAAGLSSTHQSIEPTMDRSSSIDIENDHRQAPSKPNIESNKAFQQGNTHLNNHEPQLPKDSFQATVTADSQQSTPEKNIPTMGQNQTLAQQAYNEPSLRETNSHTTIQHTSTERQTLEDIGQPHFKAAPNFSSARTPQPTPQAINEAPHTQEPYNNAPSPSSVAPSHLDHSNQVDEEDDMYRGIPEASLSEWAGFVEQLQLNGLVRELAMNMACADLHAEPMRLSLDPNFQYLKNASRENAIIEEIRKLRGTNYKVNIEIETTVHETPSERIKRLTEERDKNTLQELKSDPAVQSVMNTFDLRIDESSIKPK